MLVVAYIGFGKSVRRYHIPYVESKENIKIKYVFRREEDRVGDEECEKAYPEIIFTTDFNQVLNDPEVNLVVVNTPDRFHVSYAKQILNAGKNALVEKPFAMKAAEAREVFNLAKEKGLTVMANQNRRFDADFQTVQKVLETGKLGDIVELESHYDYFAPGGWGMGFGLLHGLAIHTIDQVISLFGAPDHTVMDVRSLWDPGKADDYYDFDFFYGNRKAIVKTSQSVLIDYPRFTVHGTKGSFIVWPLPHQSAAKDDPNARVKISMEPQPKSTWGLLRYIGEDGQRHDEEIPLEVQDYGKIYDNLYDVIFNGGEKIVKDEEVIIVLEIIEAADQKVRSEGKK